MAYINDLRSIGFPLEPLYQISRRLCSYLQHLGIHDSVRKRRLNEGPWARCVYSTIDKYVTKTVSKEKWE